MSDRRLTPDPAKITEDTAMQIIVPIVDLHCILKGPRDRQLLFGAQVIRLSVSGAWAYVQEMQNGYVGYVLNTTLGQATPSTHQVSAPATHVYTAADLKSPNRMALSHLSQLTVLATSNTFFETTSGFVPCQHAREIAVVDTDPASVAEKYLGTDYLWGGNSRWGIDCSGLVQASLTVCGIPCPGDSDMQMSLGAPATDGYKRNDLLFWKGHVALVSDSNSIIHANAHTMAVNHEAIDQAIARIAANGDGPVTAHRRLSSLFG